MSAAATAAGYLYASGRLRGKNKESEEHDRGMAHAPARRRTLRATPPQQLEEAPLAPAKPPKPVRIEYRTRRWKPEHVN